MTASTRPPEKRVPFCRTVYTQTATQGYRAHNEPSPFEGWLTKCVLLQRNAVSQAHSTCLHPTVRQVPVALARHARYLVSWCQKPRT